MTIENEYFIVDNIDTSTECGTYLKLEDGLNIRYKLPDATIDFAKISVDDYHNYNLTFYSTNFQDYIVDHDKFIDLVRTIDDGYDYLDSQFYRLEEESLK